MAGDKTSRWRRKLRLAIIVDKSFEELFSIRFNLVTLFFIVSALVIMLIGAITYLIAFTGLREYIPGYPSGEERRMVMNNLQRVDSLIVEVRLRDALLTNMRQVIAGEMPVDAFNSDSVAEATRLEHNNIAQLFQKSKTDSIFRTQVESDDNFNVDAKKESTNTQLEMMFLFPPMKGIVSDKFGEKNAHFGVDILGAEGTRVSSILDGTVIFADWTVETGYVIEIQHDNQIISIYKHNGRLLKKPGQRVSAGEAIAMVGNSGSMTTGPHLHFELWYSGVPLNPENYISFE